jgi:hypothetical protein
VTNIAGIAHKASTSGRWYRRRPTAWLDWRTGRAVDVHGSDVKLPAGPAVGALLEQLERLGGPEGCPEVVYLTGPPPGGTRPKMRGWAWGESGRGSKVLPDGWAPGRHWWPDSGAPALRYRRPDGVEVSLLLAESWFGGADVSPRAGRDALHDLERMLSTGCGAPILSTPVQTGLETLRRTVRTDREPWPDDVQDMVRSTAGQHRMEMLPGTYGQVVELDMKLAYSAVCWGLGAGPPVWYSEWDPAAGARWKVRFRAQGPVGLLPVMDRGTWAWPVDGVHESWVDGSEVAVALRADWDVRIVEGVGPSDRGADPLGPWSKMLGSIIHVYELAGDDLAYRAARAVLVQGIGGMVGRPQKVYRTLPEDQKAHVPADALGGSVRIVGGHVTWAEMAPARRGDLAHPEWCAKIWGRTRARLLWKRDGTGVLNLPVDVEVAGYRGDALYLTGDPGWPYQGRPGQWRVKRVTPGPLEVRNLGDYDRAVNGGA